MPASSSSSSPHSSLGRVEHTTVFMWWIVIVLYLGQETAKAQSGLMLEIVQDKGNVDQAILELQKRLEAVSVRPWPLSPSVCFWLCY